MDRNVLFYGPPLTHVSMEPLFHRLTSGMTMNDAAKSIIARVASIFLLAASCQMPAMAQNAFQSDCPERTEVNLPVYKWGEMPQNPRGVVLMVHGVTQDTLSLSPLANTLAENGFLVYGIDQRGHGWWHFNNDKKVKGYRCDFNQSVRDVDQVLPLLKDEYPELPMFLVGESCGASVVLRAAVHAPGLVNGLVLAGAGYKSPHIKTSWLVGDLLKSTTTFHHQINVQRYQLKYGSDDVASIRESFKDKLQRPSLGAREILGCARFVSHNAKYVRRLDPNCSVFIVQGEKDRVLTPKSARRVFALAPSANKDMLVVKGCGHVLLGTNHMKPIVSQSITTWLQRNSEPSAVASTVQTESPAQQTDQADAKQVASVPGAM